jgi:starch synthase (maltosyl-transferring)
VVVRAIEPTVDGGRHPLKRVVGETVTVTADAFCDGHDRVAAVVEHRPGPTADWTSEAMTVGRNDRWTATFTVTTPGTTEFRVVAWVDHATTWREHLRKKALAGVDVPVQLASGAELLTAMVRGQRSAVAKRVRDAGRVLADDDLPLGDRVAVGLDEALGDDLVAVDPRTHATSTPSLRVAVDRERAAFSAWYELFPRSLGGPDRHGTLADVLDQLPRVARMGFDVLYLPPVHPIGVTHRKGRNNSTVATSDDVGVPWAIGGSDGGHTAVHAELGTVEDVARLATVAREQHGIDLALDLAFQCTPDHPWVTEHPEWFRQRPDGTIQYAENPPKKYEDIYPLDFETSDAAGLWQALLEVTLFWVEQGVKVFRVDNPHTKSFRFWEWMIAEVRAVDADVLFLAEAFTRPRVMEELAKRGFSQSYSYFTWREEKWELEQYVREMFHTEHIDWMRPNFWPNTPDILPEHLQSGQRATFVARLVLAALLDANYGVYGPAFELMEHTPRAPGSEEYLDSEKYQLRSWDLDSETSLEPLLRAVNEVRRAHPALQRNRNLTQHTVDDDHLLAWSKCTDDGSDVVLVIVNLDPHNRRGATVHLDLGGLRVEPGDGFDLHDTLTGHTYQWHGADNYVELDPSLPAHVFHVRSAW